MKTVLMKVFSVSLFAYVSVYTVLGVQFDRDCCDYLRRASNASTVELASTELGAAIKYIEDRGLTSGNTSALYASPSDDMGYLYYNLKQSLSQLSQASDKSQLEKSNVLMKLNETLTYQGDSGRCLNGPGGMWLYPYNTAFAIWGMISLVGFLVLLGIKLYDM